MTNKIYYLARSYSPYQNGGGSLMRAGAVINLQKLGWKVVVIMPNYNTKEIIMENNIIQIPFDSKHFQKLSSLFERIGIYEDYLDKWVENAFKYLQNKIKKKDIIFATSGGELGMIKLGSLLKNKIGCKFVVNFHDPLNYGYMNGLRRDIKPHIGRVKAQEKYISNANLILTSSQYYADTLKRRFLSLEQKIYNNYFGYIKQIDINKYKKMKSKKLRIAYAGIMSSVQKPELLYQAYKNIVKNRNIEIYFIGNRNNYKPLNSIKDNNVYFIDYLPHEEFLRFMRKNIDVGFVSLVRDYYGACVPSKIYEYINLGLPMIGALAEGDGMNIINDRGYGKAVKYNNSDMLSKVIEDFQREDYLKSKEQNILKDRNIWNMENTILEVEGLLKQL